MENEVLGNDELLQKLRDSRRRFQRHMQQLLEKVRSPAARWQGREASEAGKAGWGAGVRRKAMGRGGGVWGRGSGERTGKVVSEVQGAGRRAWLSGGGGGVGEGVSPQLGPGALPPRTRLYAPFSPAVQPALRGCPGGANVHADLRDAPRYGITPPFLNIYS